MRLVRPKAQRVRVCDKHAVRTHTHTQQCTRLSQHLSVDPYPDP